MIKKSKDVSSRKTGPATEEGRRRISAANTKTGKWTNKAIEDKKKSRRLILGTIEMLNQVQRKIDLWQCMNQGDTAALLELTQEVFGEDLESRL